MIINFDEIYKMKQINKNTVLETHARTRRICFKTYPWHLPKKTNGGRFYGTINLPFGDGIISRSFPAHLFRDKFRAGRVWLGIETEEQFNKLTEWCRERENYVYMLDCLSASAALGQIRENDAQDRTEVGRLVFQTKYRSESDVITRLIEMILEFIDKHAIYQECEDVAAVPPRPDQTYNLPSEIVARVSENLSLPNITSGFRFGGCKNSAREMPFDKKWDDWESARLAYQGENLDRARILLIDDNYQSGISLQYTAMILQRSGAHQVYGLTMTKTRGNRDN